MRAVPLAHKVALAQPFLEQAGLVPSPPPADLAPRLAEILRAAGERVKVAGDVLDYADFFTPDERLAYDDKAFDKRLRKPAEAAGLLTSFRDQLRTLDPFDAPQLERLLHDFVTSAEIQVGQLIHALRVAVTGKAVGFGLFETLAVLGRECVVRRIDLALAKLTDSQTC